MQHSDTYLDAINEYGNSNIDGYDQISDQISTLRLIAFFEGLISDQSTYLKVETIDGGDLSKGSVRITYTETGQSFMCNEFETWPENYRAALSGLKDHIIDNIKSQ